MRAGLVPRGVPGLAAEPGTAPHGTDPALDGRELRVGHERTREQLPLPPTGQRVDEKPESIPAAGVGSCGQASLHQRRLRSSGAWRARGAGPGQGAADRTRLMGVIAAISGVVHGKVIELDEVMPGLEGRRVRVVVEPLEVTATDPVELRRAWEAWAARGVEGPIEDDGEPELP